MLEEEVAQDNNKAKQHSHRGHLFLSLEKLYFGFPVTRNTGKMNCQFNMLPLGSLKGVGNPGPKPIGYIDYRVSYLLGMKGS